MTIEFPNNLREYRLKAGLRQSDVASRLGLDCADRLSRWENGKAAPSIVNLFKLAALYGAPAEKLYAELCERLTGQIAEKLIDRVSARPTELTKRSMQNPLSK